MHQRWLLFAVFFDISIFSIDISCGYCCCIHFYLAFEDSPVRQEIFSKFNVLQFIAYQKGKANLNVKVYLTKVRSNRSGVIGFPVKRLFMLVINAHKLNKLNIRKDLINNPTLTSSVFKNSSITKLLITQQQNQLF